MRDDEGVDEAVWPGTSWRVPGVVDELRRRRVLTAARSVSPDPAMVSAVGAVLNVEGAGPVSVADAAARFGVCADRLVQVRSQTQARMSVGSSGQGDAVVVPFRVG